MRSLAVDGRALSAVARQFDVVADTWDAQHGPASVRAREFAARIRYLRARCRDLGRPRVLDLGCGTGQTLIYVVNHIATGIGVDISPGMIACARRNAARTPLQFRVGDAADFCMQCRARFDLVLLLGAFEHLPDQAAALTGAERVLAANGRVIIIAPHPWNPVFCIKRLIDGADDAPPSDHLSPLRLRGLALSHGLELSALRALPYAPWTAIGAVLGNGQSRPNRAGRRNPSAGILRGAFAAEFYRRR